MLNNSNYALIILSNIFIFISNNMNRIIYAYVGNYSLFRTVKECLKIKISNSNFKNNVIIFFMEYGKLELDNCNYYFIL